MRKNVFPAISLLLICLFWGNHGVSQTQLNVLIQPGQAEWEQYLQAADQLGPQKVSPPASLVSGSAILNHLTAVSRLISTTATGPDESFRWYTITLDSTVASTAESWFLAQGVFEEVAPVRTYQLDHTTYTPNDDSLDRQWYHQYIESEAAWDISRGSATVRIGVIDTGIDYLHPEFDDQIWINPNEDLNGNGQIDPWPSSEIRNGISGDFDGVDNDQNGFADDVIGYDFTDQPNDPSFGDFDIPDPDPYDDNNHGTLVSGVISAKMDNSFGGTGLAPDCKVVVLRAFAADGSGQDDDIARSIVYATDLGVPILNFSFGDIYPSRIMKAAIEYAYVRGVIMVGSAGNGKGDQLHYPSGFPEVISVSASTFDPQTGREFFWPLSSYGVTVDLCAPGAGILTTQIMDTLSDGTVEYFTRTQGTSFSAPLVSAAVGLIFASKGPVSPEAARGLLRSTTDDISNTGWDHFTGAGRLNVRKLLTATGGSEVSIYSPANDEGSPDDELIFIGTVLHPEFELFHLEYQPGIEGGSEWFPILMDQPYQTINDTLGIWDITTLEEGEYTIRLRMDKSDGFTIEDRIRFVRDTSPPELTILDAVNAWVDYRNGQMFRFRSSDQGRHTLHYRRVGEPLFRQETADRFTRNEDFFLGQDELLSGEYEWFLESENLAGLTSQTPLATFEFTSRSTPRLGVEPTGASIPMGRYVETPYDWDGDGQLEVVMSEYDESLSFGPLMWYEYNGSFFRKVDSITRSGILIPKGVADVDQNGTLELLASVNDSMYVFTGASDEFPKQILWSEEDNGRYAAGLSDTDGDGLPELQARDTESFYVYEWSGQFDEVATLVNNSPENLAPGLARLWTADTDGDGRPELLFGDADADLIAYEHNSGDSYSEVLIDSAAYGEANAETFITTGDFDGDGEVEWFAAIHTSDLENADDEYESPFWRLRIYDKAPGGGFEVAWEDFLWDNETKTFSAATSGNLDQDPADEIIFSTFPRTYLLEYDLGEYAFTYYVYGNIQTQHVIGDFNGNGIQEFTLGRGDSAFFFEKQVFYNGPDPVTSLRGRVLGPDRVEVTWNESGNATGYQLLRLPDPEQNNLAVLISPLTGAEYLDQGLTEDVPHLYLMRSLNPGLSPDTSGFGNGIILVPHERPRLDSVVALSATQIQAFFSQPVRDREADKGRFKVDGTIIPLGLLPSASTNSLILSLSKPLEEGFHQLTIDTTFMDALRGVLDPLYSTASFEYQQVEEDFLILTQWEIVDGKTGRLQFNYPLDEATALDTSNYLLEPLGSISSVEWGSEDFDVIDITIDEAVFGALGYPLSITVSDVCAIHGICIGDVGSTATFSDHKEDLSEVYVYPNPVRNHELFDGLRFANLTREANIEVFSVSGRMVKRLEERDGDGGLEWDLRDDGGFRIKPGIYLYRVYQEDGLVDEFVGKFSLVE